MLISPFTNTLLKSKVVSVDIYLMDLSLLEQLYFSLTKD